MGEVGINLTSNYCIFALFEFWLLEGLKNLISNKFILYPSQHAIFNLFYSKIYLPFDVKQLGEAKKIIKIVFL